VIHSFALPSAGLKLDAVPGKLNELITVFKTTGLYYGQCSELCGVNHSFMPLQVNIVPRADFIVDRLNLDLED